MFEKEYETLRQELNDNKKYVFERPILIITAALVFSEYIVDTPFSMMFPIIAIYLLLFNLKFTCNRLNSNARIVSYIRLFIEEKEPSHFKWETFLAKYREEGENKGLRFYPLIYWFHIIAIGVFFLVTVFLYFKDPIDIDFYNPVIETVKILTVLSFLFGLFFFIKVAIETSPKKVKDYFEKEIVNVENTIKKL